MHHQHLQTEITSLENNNNIDPDILLKFLKRLKQPKYIREESPSDHFCVFFLPIDLKTQQIYLGHHKKAGDWIPPGGHIEPNEHPLDTVKREMFEELQFKLTNEEVRLFDLTIKNINKPHRACKRHYDLWYLVFMDKTDFIFDPREYYDAKWFPKSQAQNLTKEKNYREAINKILNNFFNP